MTCVSPKPAATFGPTDPNGSLAFGGLSRGGSERTCRRSRTTSTPVGVTSSTGNHLAMDLHGVSTYGTLSPMGPKRRTPKQLRDRTPYNTMEYKQTKALLKAVYHQCWVTDEDGRCQRQGTIPDHDPPIAMVPNPREWRGTLRPQCAHHSRKQSGLIRHGKTYRPIPTRQW